MDSGVLGESQRASLHRMQGLSKGCRDGLEGRPSPVCATLPGDSGTKPVTKTTSIIDAVRGFAENGLIKILRARPRRNCRGFQMSLPGIIPFAPALAWISVPLRAVPGQKGSPLFLNKYLCWLLHAKRERQFLRREAEYLHRLARIVIHEGDTTCPEYVQLGLQLLFWAILKQLFVIPAAYKT